MRRTLLSAVCLALLPLVGCGKSETFVPVSGLLTWEDGNPIAEAQINFLPEGSEGQPASGFSGKDGSFTLTTKNSGDGAAPGRYKVVVKKQAPVFIPEVGRDADPTAKMKEFAVKQPKSKSGLQPTPKAKLDPELPAIYAKADTTPLRWTIEPGGPKVHLKLTKT